MNPKETFLNKRSLRNFMTKDNMDYISIEDAKKYAIMYHEEQVKNSVDLTDVSNSVCADCLGVNIIDDDEGIWCADCGWTKDK